MAARSSGKRDTVKNPAGTFYAQRTAGGQFKDLTEKGKSLARDRQTKAKTVVKSGFGHKGDRAH